MQHASASKVENNIILNCKDHNTDIKWLKELHKVKNTEFVFSDLNCIPILGSIITILMH